MFVRNLLVAASFASVAVTGFAKDPHKDAGTKATAAVECTTHKEAASCSKDKACKWTVDAKAPTKGTCGKAEEKTK